MGKFSTLIRESGSADERNAADFLADYLKGWNMSYEMHKPEFDLDKDLHNISAPTLVTVGRHDWITPVECSELIAEKIPNSQLIIFENSGHSLHQEENKDYLDLVREFLSKVSSPVNK